MGFKSRSLSWIVSSALYRFSYIRIAHQLDDDLFAYLDGRIEGMEVVDCGCGPGVLTEKLVSRGAVRVFAVDGNKSMLLQVQTRLPEAVQNGKVVPIQSRFHPQLFTQLQALLPEPVGFDLILFKRSLYVAPDQAQSILQAASASLQPGGCIVIIHPEPSFGLYAFGPNGKFMSYTPYHLVNRLASRLSHRVGVGDYQLYTQAEWSDLLQRAAPGLRVEAIPSNQQSYNLLAAWAPC